MRTMIVILTLLSLAEGFAQAPRHADTTGVSSFATVTLRYKNDYYYMGRADSMKAPYVTSSLGYYHKSGLFFIGSFSYLTAPEENRLDLVVMSAGYDHFGIKVAGGIAVDQYFFSEESYAVQAEVSTYFSGYVGYDFDAFVAVMDASLGVSDNVDVFVGGEISRTFYAMRSRLFLVPSFYVNFGTQRYYNQYYTQRASATGGMSGHGSGTRWSSPGGVTINELTITESEKFQVLDYELGLTASYTLNKFRLSLSGTFLFPVNPATVVTDNGTYEEDLDTGFQWSAGARYRIGK